MAQPGLSVEERLAALEGSVECSSAADRFAGFRNLPFGRENTYRLGLSASQNLFTGGRLRGLSQTATAGVRTAELGVTVAQAQMLLDVTQAYYGATLRERLVAIAEPTGRVSVSASRKATRSRLSCLVRWRGSDDRV